MRVRGNSSLERAVDARCRLARTTAASLTVLLMLASVVGGVFEGARGAASAAVGVALTAILFGGGLIGMLRPAPGKNPIGPVLVASMVRFMLYAPAGVVVTRAEWVHGPSLASATAASIAGMIAVEVRALGKESGVELELEGSSRDGAGTATDA